MIKNIYLSFVHYLNNTKNEVMGENPEKPRLKPVNKTAQNRQKQLEKKSGEKHMVCYSITTKK